MELMKDSSEIAYQAFFFDDSLDNEPFKLIAHFKKVGDTEKWDNVVSLTRYLRVVKKVLSLESNQLQPIQKPQKAN
jgi:hypothetical protein